MVLFLSEYSLQKMYNEKLFFYSVGVSVWLFLNSGMISLINAINKFSIPITNKILAY